MAIGDEAALTGKAKSGIHDHQVEKMIAAGTDLQAFEFILNRKILL
jgi:hypothetical protein